MDRTDSCCSYMMDPQDEIISLEKGLDLIISNNPLTMGGGVRVLLAANRMKRFLSAKQKLSNKELCRMIKDSVIQTTVVGVALESSCPSGQSLQVFTRLDSWETYMTDEDKKDIILKTEATQLQAATLSATNCSDKVKFKMGTYICLGERQTVVLSIINQNLYISCSMKGDKAELKLENCSAEDVKEISKDGATDRFLFYTCGKETDRQRFESVLCRGWFMCTHYNQEDKPLEMCTEGADHRLISFTMSQR